MTSPFLIIGTFSNVRAPQAWLLVMRARRRPYQRPGPPALPPEDGRASEKCQKAAPFDLIVHTLAARCAARRAETCSPRAATLSRTRPRKCESRVPVLTQRQAVMRRAKS